MDVLELVHHHASDYPLLSEARDEGVPKGAPDYCDSLKRSLFEACLKLVVTSRIMHAI
jgi:hypothetical protein